MDFTPDQAASLAEVLRWRRDVRHFRPDPIAEPVMERLRAAMEMAPSVGNARPWRVLRVKTQPLRDQVAAEFERCRAAAGARYDPARQTAYQGLKLAGIDQAPEQLAVFTVIDPAEGAGLGRQTMPETLRQSTAMAVHTLWLAARAENLGLGMLSIVDPRAMERIFDVPADWEFSAYLCLGTPEFTDDTPLLHRSGWQENTPTLWQVQ